MEKDYSNLISFSRIKETLDEKRMTSSVLAEKIGMTLPRLSAIESAGAMPLSGAVAKIAGVLKVRVSDICVFRGYEIKDCFKGELLYEPDAEAGTELTYRPLRLFLEKYLDEHPGKTADDIYDKVESVRVARKTIDAELRAKMLRGRGIDPDAEPKEKRSRRDYSRGLSYELRTKLRRDRPMNIRVIYDICKYLGCGIDFVMSYK